MYLIHTDYSLKPIFNVLLFLEWKNPYCKPAELIIESGEPCLSHGKAYAHFVKNIWIKKSFMQTKIFKFISKFIGGQMTYYQRREYEKRYEIEKYRCAKTGKRATQIAHRISNSKVNRKLYGNKIDHNFNLVPVCDLESNDSFNIGGNPGKVTNLIYLIENCQDEDLTCDYITKFIEDEK